MFLKVTSAICWPLFFRFQCSLSCHTPAYPLSIFWVMTPCCFSVWSCRIYLQLWRYPTPDSKLQGANVGPTWGRQDPDGPHVGHMNLAIWGIISLQKNAMKSRWLLEWIPFHDMEILINISIINTSELVLILIMAWCQTGDKPFLFFSWRTAWCLGPLLLA